MIGTPREASLKALVGADVRVKVVDVGANPIDGKPPYTPLLQSGIGDVIGFDPNPESIARLNARKSDAETYLPLAVGDGRRRTLHKCVNPGMTSLLKPNPEVLRLFHAFTAWGTIVGTDEVDTRRLDDIEETKGLDLLKLDIQGAELMVLENATERLRDALVVQAEVEFLKMYVDQPLFGDVAGFMQRHGFQFHRFYPLVNRVVVPLALHDDLYAGLSQVLWADAVFVRDLTRLDALTPRQLLALATIMHDCYGSVDVALHVLGVHDQRQGTKLAEQYLPRLSRFPGLVEWIIAGQPLPPVRAPFPKADGSVPVTRPANESARDELKPVAPPPSPLPSAAKPRKVAAKSPRKVARSGR